MWRQIVPHEGGHLSVGRAEGRPGEIGGRSADYQVTVRGSPELPLLTGQKVRKAFPNFNQEAPRL